MDLIYINAYTRFYQNSSICSEDIDENTFLHQSRAITLLFIYEFSPFAIPNHSSLISMFMQCLKKIGQKLLKSESGNEAPTDGRTDRHSKRFGGYNIKHRHLFVAGYKDKGTTTQQQSDSGKHDISTHCPRVYQVQSSRPQSS